MVRYLNPANHHPARITKADQDFAKKLDFKNKKFPVQVRDLKKKGIPLALVSFLVMKIRKNIQFIYKKNVKKNMLIYQRHKTNVLIIDFNTFMYDHTLHHVKNNFCCYCFLAFSTKETLKVVSTTFLLVCFLSLN